MTKRLISLLLAAVMLLSMLACMTSCSTEEETTTAAAEEDVQRKNLALTIYAITGDDTTEEALALVEEKISNYCVAKYKTAIDLRFYKESEYQSALNAMYDKFKAEEEAKKKAEEEAKKKAEEEKAYYKTLSAAEKKKYDQEKRLAQKKAEEEAKKKAEEEAALIEQNKDVAQVKEVQMDILFIPGASEYYSAVEQGLLTDLTQYLASQFKIVKDYVYPTFLTAATVNSAIYAVPNNHAISTDETYFVVNKALAEKYNVDWSTVRSITDLEEVYAQIVANEGGVTPIYGDFDPEGYYFYDGVDSGHLLGVFTDTLLGGRYGNPSVASPAVNSMLKDYALTEGDQRTAVLDYAATKYQYRTANYLSDTNENFFLTVKTLSEEEKKEWQDKGYLTVLYKGADFNTEVAFESGLFAISKYCAEPVRAMEVLQLLSTDAEFRNLLAFGVEDVNYELTQVGGNTIKMLNNTYSMDFNTAGNSLIGYLPETMDPDYIKKGIAKNLNSYANPFLGLQYTWSESDLARIAELKAIVGPVWDQLSYGVPNWRELMNDTYSLIENNEGGILTDSFKNFRAQCTFFSTYGPVGTALKKLDAQLDLSTVVATTPAA